jgi:hypothetical protein
MARTEGIQFSIAKHCLWSSNLQGSIKKKKDLERCPV